MAESDIGTNDIVFECPHCDKSLAIDRRGAGLTIKCPDCGGSIDVPIPDDVDISDIDRLGIMEVGGVGDDEVPLRPPKTSEDMRRMLMDMEELRFRRRYLEQRVAAASKALPILHAQVNAVRASLDKIEVVLARLSESSSDETRTLS